MAFNTRFYSSTQGDPHKLMGNSSGAGNSTQGHLGQMGGPFRELYFGSKAMSSQTLHSTQRNQPWNPEEDEEELSEEEYVELEHGVVLKSAIRGRPARRHRNNGTRLTNIQGNPRIDNSHTSTASSPNDSLPPSTVNTSPASISAPAPRRSYARNAAGGYPCPQCTKTYETSSPVARLDEQSTTKLRRDATLVAKLSRTNGDVTATKKILRKDSVLWTSNGAAIPATQTTQSGRQVDVQVTMVRLHPEPFSPLLEAERPKIFNR
ncbi:hypothetical protein BKA64DRAFT_710907 [Cadophora sp. MPI-SDFR-AT-0126]|nr:hypothetical protein BKA64DRAFT_710907 [Leotiomycetes sp. MPI-SDFR-AT-0126]